ncbi:MAG: FAD-dependent thymidylate synthase [Ruminococcaceae bacterium]|nr:FAD-dependent thymidylate synthase [Oscillospiraceae bacterium]
MKVTLLSHTPNPEQVIACAARLCYSSASVQSVMDGLTPDKTEDFIQMLTNMGHESPFEHVTFTFGIEGVSRSLLAQITRHRMASFSVKSQRYVKEFEFSFVTPPEIAKDPEALAVYKAAMEQDRMQYEQLETILFTRHKKRLIEEGKDEKTATRMAEKAAIEDARYVLPNACETQMMVTMNVRSLWNFFRLRCCNRAQWEIRDLAEQMLMLCRDVAPSLFSKAGPGCVAGACPEGAMTCGKAKEMKEKYGAAK